MLWWGIRVGEDDKVIFLMVNDDDDDDDDDDYHHHDDHNQLLPTYDFYQASGTKSRHNQ